MAHILEDRVQETSTTTGTGALTLAGAVTGFRAFSSVCATNDTCPYFIEAVDGNGIPTGEWETGIGTYSGTNTLTRTLVLESSNAGAAVNFSAGTKRVGIGALAQSREWKLLSTATPTGVSSVVIGSIPSYYKDILIDVIGLSHNSGSSQFFYIDVSSDGSTWSSDTLFFGGSLAAAAAASGFVLIEDRQREYGRLLTGNAQTAASPKLLTGGASVGYRLANGLASVRFRAGGGNIDAGTINLYGR